MTKKPKVIGTHDFAIKFAKKLGKTQKEAKTDVSAFIELLEEEIGKGNTVNFIGFGKWEIRERSARKGRNPHTGEEIDIPASKVPAFKAGAKLKSAIK